MTQCYIQCAPGTLHRCDDCGREFDARVLDMIVDVQERLTPGSPTPSGQCPECGALTYQVDLTNRDDLPDERLFDIEQPEVLAALRAHEEYFDEPWQPAQDICVEEMGELLTAFIHVKRGRASTEKVAEEIADVLLSTRLLIHLGDFESSVMEVLRQKARRFMDRVRAGGVRGQ